MVLFALVAVALAWMHLAIRPMEREAPWRDAGPRCRNSPKCRTSTTPSDTAMPRMLEDWRPEDPAFWEETGRAIARRNLWISIPALLLAFSVWMVWSVVVAQAARDRL